MMQTHISLFKDADCHKKNHIFGPITKKLSFRKLPEKTYFHTAECIRCLTYRNFKRHLIDIVWIMHF